MLSDNFFYDTFKAGAKGAGPPTSELGPLLFTIHITNMQHNYYFLTNSSCFQLKSTLEVL